MSQARQASELGQDPIAVERSNFDERGILTDPDPRAISVVERRVEHVIAQLAVRKGFAENLNAVHVRDLIPQLDLQSGGDNSALENAWVQDTLTADQLNETYTIDHGNLAEDKIIAFYAISNVNVSPSTTEVRFNTAQGGVFEILQTEGLLTDDEVIGLLNDPIISQGSEQDYAIEQYVTATSDNLVFHGKVAEERGTEMEPANQNFLSGINLGSSGGAGGQGR